MANDLITSESVSRELLQSLFDAAFMETSLDSDGDIVVKDDCNAWVIPDAEKNRVRIFTLWRFEESASDLQKLRCANDINAKYIIARACVSPDGRRAHIGYDLSLEGGVTRKALVLLVKRFCGLVPVAVKNCGDGIIA